MARKISRRNFITGGAAIASAAVLAGCEQGTRWVTLEPYVRPPEEQLDGVPTFYASTCRGCSAGCGILARVMNGRALKLEGNPEHPLNRGKLCAQGQSGPQLLYNPDRLYRPLQTVKRGGGDFATVPWDSALSVLAGKIKEAGNAVAVLATPNMSGHLYDLLQRFTKAIGAPAPVIWDLQTAWNGNVTLAATADPLFGKAGVPAYNVSGADVIYSFGADIVGTWDSPTRYNIEYGQFRTQPKGLRGYLAQFEPYMSLTGAKADQWVGLRPGYEGLVAQAISRLIADGKFGPPEWQARAAAVAGHVDPAAVATASQVSLEQLTKLARVYAEANHPVAVPGNALAGPDAVAAVQGLNIITGGAGIVLSADLPGADLVRPTLSTYADLQKLIAQMAGGAVKILLIYGANPVYELPPAAGFMDALNQVGYVVTTTTMMTETAANSNLVVPDRTYLESWGYTVVAPNFGMPMVSSQQPVVQPVQDVRSAGDVLVAVAKNVPAAASVFTWSDEVAFLKDVVLKLPPGAAGGTGPDLLWARFLQHGGWWPSQAPAPVPVKTGNPPNAAVTPPAPQGDPAQYPFELHPFPHILLGVGGGANIPWLQGSPDTLTSIAWQSWVCIHPDTAKTLGVQKGDVVRLTTPYGEVEAEVYVTPVIRADTIAIPFGQGHQVYGRYAENRGVNAVHLLGAQPGPGGLEPNWAGLRCRVTPTGQTAKVATLEFTPGVEAGFFNKSFPGQ